MPYRIGKIGVHTPAAAVAHDCQVLRETLYPEGFDAVATRSSRPRAPSR
ncbi:hypothetical protein IS481_13195 [Caldimonas thermodepolymerans]|jgi:5-formyltetrahydrofolate cyclo-ligase|uniref:Uncharacterized protein n=1 Tax=Caldimonas thermodepolymerans TaxID=215580 RepID=A0AA46DG96_9BURK|nr:hypothetical protein [Caldimonas thermodepolymerans]QPC30704.1 hypothetical protein IS481_13195 [Caldimonas thermodepolymerans]RDI02680.1 hypothetical protein DES46_102107 [Caldimonas thermodepolymerans]TCP08790.1 hypothetical protein EV676_102298 [Caldimonas thermodepolymerans]UZG47111.1 hypothetical protein ONS87_14325 [Caldimonas thermodepolymerans]